MSFSENLKLIRKEKGISQEELAEILDVSRQAVSKWEQSNGYPEVEKLLLLASKLNISLDSLMAEEIIQSDCKKIVNMSGKILIKTYNNTIVNCFKVTTAKLFMRKESKKNANYAFFGIDSTSMLGENTTVLGFYLKKDDIDKETDEIMNAMKNGESAYELKYTTNIKTNWGGFMILR